MLSDQELENHLRRAELLAVLLDSQFNVFGVRIGLDPLIGLIPVAGDILTAGISMYMVWIGIEMGLPIMSIIRMIINVVFDYILDFIPFLGNIFDVVFRSNLRNVEILRKYYDKRVGIVEGEVME